MVLLTQIKIEGKGGAGNTSPEKTDKYSPAALLKASLGELVPIENKKAEFLKRSLSAQECLGRDFYPLFISPQRATIILRQFWFEFLRPHALMINDCAHRDHIPL